MRPLYALLIVSVLVHGSIQAGEAPLIGWIDAFSGPSEDYRLLRAGQSVPVRIMEPIREGDKIVVTRDARELLLRLGDGRIVRVGHTLEPYVARGGAVPTLPTNLMRWAASWFTQWHNEQQNTAPVSVHVRSLTAVTAPLLGKQGGRLAAGVRPLFLAWKGGRPPYQVRLSHGLGQATSVLREAEPGPRLRVDSVTLNPGHYLLEIRDATGAVARHDLIVLAGHDLPPPPAELVDSAAAIQPWRETLIAAWLASRDEGAWALEAYQRVAAIADGYYPAALLRDSLERGEQPRDPPQ